MKPLKYNWIAWLVFGIYLLNLVFLWAIDGKKTTIMDDKEEATKEAKIISRIIKRQK